MESPHIMAHDVGDAQVSPPSKVHKTPTPLWITRATRNNA
eukprot:CAMPEP_0175745120 /NCGR_PEP_ID=MMETSP0097-20121207/57908_1 /TAXON_ID=311494 /ORGANISM="Alexandrium monilatum, Strain CCMP3105" /LENGTH=39 /DNA_ID= /DNA_START= /DNA_END= /DNA_ORIENTATION=